MYHGQTHDGYFCEMFQVSIPSSNVYENSYFEQSFYFKQTLELH